MRKTSIVKTPLPESALLASYAQNGSYVDCYSTRVTGAVSHAKFVTAFYTTWLFKIERTLLKWVLNKPSTDHDAIALAERTQMSFAAWTVEEQAINQLLLCDVSGRTRSWLMTISTERGNNEGTVTQLYFGSAVVPTKNVETGEYRMGYAFQSLLGFHKLYSRALLRAAVTQLKRQRVAKR